MRLTNLVIAVPLVLAAACDTSTAPSILPERQAAAATMLPIQQSSTGSMQIIGWCDQAAGIVLVAVPGSGTATHVGAFEVEQSNCANPATGMFTNGTATVVAANGDEIDMTYTGHTVTASGLPVYELAYVVTGGTGRFVNAEGELTVSVVYTSPTTWVSRGSGWITYQASDRSE